MAIRMKKAKQIFIDCRYNIVLNKPLIFFMSIVFIIDLITSVLIKCELFIFKYNGIYFIIL